MVAITSTVHQRQPPSSGLHPLLSVSHCPRLLCLYIQNLTTQEVCKEGVALEQPPQMARLHSTVQHQTMTRFNMNRSQQKEMS